MLPYSPLHHLLLDSVGGPLVMTSGNLSDEPIAHDDDDAIGRLGPLTDGLLSHDRPIHIRCDDSIRVRNPDECSCCVARVAMPPSRSGCRSTPRPSPSSPLERS